MHSTCEEINSFITVIEIGIETAVFLAISNPIKTAVLGSILTVSVFFGKRHSSNVWCRER